MHLSSWRRLAAGVGGALLVAGCAPQVFYTPVVPAPRRLAARPLEEVETFLITPPARPHTDVGVLQVTGAGFGTKELIRELRARAARVGCDALLITSIDRRVSDATSPSIQGSCIVYNDVSSTAAAPAATPPQPAGTAAAPQPGWRIGIVTGTETVEVRTAPHDVAPLLWRLYPGSRVTAAAETHDGWRFVALPDGRRGFVPDWAIRIE